MALTTPLRASIARRPVCAVPIATESSMHRATVPSRARQSLTVIRVAVATVMIVHGVYRATQEGFVAGFGEFLSNEGLPFGVAIATAITTWEIVGGVMLALGR